jgi:DNA-binding XRE family transcriptional regulator
LGSLPECCRGRRWQDDPDIREHVDLLLVRLSQDVNALRELAGWSQDTTAMVAGVAPNTILDLEQARTDPHISTVVRLAYALGYVTELRFRPAVTRPSIPPA